MIILDNKSKVPIYKQVYLKIEELIVLGVLKPNEQLPSTRAFAMELAINPNTVVKAYSLLESSGLIYSMPAKGYFVSEENVKAIDKILSKEKKELANLMAKSKNLGLTEEDVMRIVKEVYVEGSK